MSSTRVLGGSLTKGSRVLNISQEGEVSGSASGDISYPSVGHAALTRHQSDGFLGRIAKSNASDQVFLNGKPLGVSFDDTLSTNINAGIYYFGESRQETYLNHKIEQRDLGQGQLYNFKGDVAFVETTNPDDPVEIINTHANDLYLPISMVDFTSEDATDGVIDPLMIREKIQRGGTEIPFQTKGIRCSLSIEDPFRKAALIAEGYDINDPSTVPFLDSPEFFGPIELPSIFNEDKVKIKPFSDTNNQQEVYFNKQSVGGTIISNDMKAALLSSTFNTSDSKEFDRTGRKGKDYAGGNVDSIAFGGLIK